MNHHAKFYTTSFIFARKYYNRTKLQKKQTNNKRYIHILPVLRKSAIGCMSKCQVDIRTVSVIGQLIKEVTFKLTFKGT